FTNNRGRPLNLNSVKIVAGVELEGELNRYIYSTGRPGTPDNDLNFVNKSGMFPGGIVTHATISSDKAWTIVTDASDGLECYIGYESPVETDREFDTKNMCFSQVFCRAYGYTDWRAVVHSTGE